MDLRGTFQLFSSRDIRNAIVGTIVVLGGLALAGITLFAHRAGETRLAGIAAVASLGFVILILIFVIPPLARNASKEASQLNLPFEFTAGGASVLGLILIVGFSAWNTGNNLLFLILSFLIAAIVISFFAGGLCLKKLDVKMRFPETIFAGEQTDILVSVTNRKRLFPSFSVVVEVRGQMHAESVIAAEIDRILPAFVAKRFSKAAIIRRTLGHFAYIARNSTLERRTEHSFAERGCFLIKDFELSTRFPFGFFRHRRRLPARETELIVLPRFEPIRQAMDDMRIDAGRFEALHRGLGQDLYSMREYLPNDDLRRVDWKATARTTHLTVREFSAEDERRVTIVLDTRVPKAIRDGYTLREILDAEQKGEHLLRPKRFEEAVSYTAALLSFFTNARAEIRFIIDTDEGEFGIGSRHLHYSLKRLAVVESTFVIKIDVSKLHRELLDPEENSHYCLVSALSEVELESDLHGRSVLYTF